MAKELTPGAEPPWLQHAKALQAIAQTGFAYARDPYDLGRYQAVRRIARFCALHADPDWPTDVD